MIYENTFNHLDKTYLPNYVKHIHELDNFVDSETCGAIINFVKEDCEIASDYPYHAKKYINSNSFYALGQISIELCELASSVFGRKLILAETPKVRSLPPAAEPIDGDGYLHKHCDSEILNGRLIDAAASMITYEGGVTPGIYEITAIIYLNKEFNGGRIIFDDYDLAINPEPGKLVMFPSGHEYMHRVEKVTDGERFFCTFFLTTPKVKMLFSKTEQNLKK